MMSRFDELLVDESSAAALSALGEDGLATSSLLILESELPDVALAAARALAEELLSPEAFELDFHLAVPEKDRWTIAELDELVLRPARVVPSERNVIVVHRAERADTAAAEHLLKTLEEPPGRTLFCFVVESSAQLLPTIRGRAARIVRLTAVAPAERARRLSELWGLPVDEASTLVAHAGAAVGLADSVAALTSEERTPLLQALARFAQAPLRSSAATQDSVELLAAIEELASAQAAQLKASASTPGAGPKKRKAPRARPAARKKSSDPIARAFTRELVRSVCARWRGELADELRVVRSAAEMARLEQGWAALDAAEEDLAAYASPVWVLAAARARADLHSG